MLGMKEREIDFIPDRLIEEPIVFRGMSDSEVLTIILVSLGFWLPTSVLLLLPFGFGLFGLGLGFGLAIGTLLIAGHYLQRLKRRMPDGLHVIYIKKNLQKKLRIIQFGFIEGSHVWDIKRSFLPNKEQKKGSL